jgi:hypothetical protein
LTRAGVDAKRAFVRAHAEEVGGLEVETVVNLLLKADAARVGAG